MKAWIFHPPKQRVKYQVTQTLKVTMIRSLGPDEANNTETQKKDQSMMEDKHSYLQAHQIQSKWEQLFPFAYFSANQNGWLCKICGEYGDGDDYWRTKAVKLQELPKHILTNHEKGKKHSAAKGKKIEMKNILSRGKIYR